MVLNDKILRKIRLDDLYIFKLLCEVRSYSKLANLVHKTQGTISTQINHLEEVLGFKLIERTPRTFSITENGLLLLDFAQELLEKFDNTLSKILSRINNPESEVKGVLKISSSSIPGEYIIPKLIGEFKQKYPKVDFQISIRNSKHAIDDLIQYNSDFAVVGRQITDFKELKTEDYESLTIGNDLILFICSKDHPLIKSHEESGVSLEQLFEEYPFIMREQGSGTRKTFENSIYYNDRINVELELDSNNSILNAIKGGNYITVLSSYTLLPYLMGDNDKLLNKKMIESLFKLGKLMENLKLINEKLKEYAILIPNGYNPIKRYFYIVRKKKKSVNKKGTAPEYDISEMGSKDPKEIFWSFIKDKKHHA
ncbi:MAG: LysR substrate-binding domain-containing protein [Promethearchaeota archaeon]